MRKLDYNRLMYITAMILIIIFLIFITCDYINLKSINALLYYDTIAFIRCIQFIVPSICLIFLYNQNTKLKTSNYIISNEKELPSGSSFVHEKKLPGGLEPPTYALRMRRSTD